MGHAKYDGMGAYHYSLLLARSLQLLLQHFLHIFQVLHTSLHCGQRLDVCLPFALFLFQLCELCLARLWIVEK